MNKKAYGFTIVELLIVIVVVAILAAISVVAYNGIQQRARNQARIAAATTIHKQLELYTHSTGQPFGGSVFCVPTTANRESGNGGMVDCIAYDKGVWSENATINANFAHADITFSYPDTPVKGRDGIVRYGIAVAHYHTIQQGMNGVLRPLILSFVLEGENQDCGNPASVRSLSDLAYSDPLHSMELAPYSRSGAGTTGCAYSLTHPSTL